MFKKIKNWVMCDPRRSALALGAVLLSVGVVWSLTVSPVTFIIVGLVIVAVAVLVPGVEEEEE